MITDNYIKMCEKAKQLQKKWKPKVGDYVWRKYNFFGEEIDKQIWDKNKMEEIIILTYASDIEGFFHATKDGETRIFNSNNEMHKKTCIYLPTQEQLQEMVLEPYSPFAKLITISDFVSDYGKFYKSSKELNDLYWSKLYPVAIESINEFWLMFVMYKKYHKIWTGEKWEEAKQAVNN